MDLLCTETVTESVTNVVPSLSRNDRTNTMLERRINTALEDPVLLEERCLQNLLKSEERFSNICAYFDNVRNEITHQMRYIVADWMLQVCEEQDSQEEVYSLAMNYLDRFLCTCNIQKNQLQLLGSACLLLASKFREPSARGLPPDMLVFYTENSITLTDLIHWELLVLAKLKWDVSVVTPQDFLKHLVTRLPLHNVDCSMIMRHSQVFIGFSARDHTFSRYTPSTICAASIVEALKGMEWFARSGITMSQFIDRLHQIIGVEQDYLHTCWERINSLVKICTASLQMVTSNKPASNSSPGNDSGVSESGSSGGGSSGHAPLDMGLDLDSGKSGRKQTTSVTPTDVRDVHF